MLLCFCVELNNYETNIDLSELADHYDPFLLKFDSVTRKVTQVTEGSKFVAEEAVRLNRYKRRKLAVVDKHTTALIVNEGFEHPADSGNMFSLSLSAQVKWTGLYAARDTMAYPLTVPLQDDSGVYNVADANEVAAMYAKAVSTINTKLAAGVVVKSQIKAAATVPEVTSLVTAYKTS